MSLYFLLGSLTHDGQRMLHTNPNLIGDRTRNMTVPGAEILGRYAVLGRYDFVMMVEADDNDAVARLSLEIGMHTGLHLETLPAIPVGFMGDWMTPDPSDQAESVGLTPDSTPEDGPGDE
ncbi:MAG: GYD domain-containing protein [Chloroflexota bacterium]|nr:GYD domain-containing protein [Chloroflexota bacterium]